MPGLPPFSRGRACRRPRRLIVALVALVTLLSATLTAVTEGAGAASATPLPTDALCGTSATDVCVVCPGSSLSSPTLCPESSLDTPPPLIDETNLGALNSDGSPELGAAEPNTTQYVATAAQQASLGDLESQAVADTISDHHLPADDTAAVESWGRDDAIGELWGLMVQAINTPEAQRTTDQENAVDWLTNAVQWQEEQAAADAGLEYTKWAGLDASEWESDVATFSNADSSTHANLAAFLTGTPTAYWYPDYVSLDPLENGVEGFCAFSAPGPYASQYTGGAGSPYASPYCEPGGCTDPLGCSIPYPTIDQLEQWGTYDADEGFDSTASVAQSVDVAEGVSFGASAIGGGALTAAGVSGALTAAGPIAVSTFASSISSSFGAAAKTAMSALDAGTAGAEGAVDGDAVADVISSISGAVGGIVGVLLAALSTAVIGILQLVQEDALPGQLAGLVENAYADPPDLASLIQSADGLLETYQVFLGATRPLPISTITCDNNSATVSGTTVVSNGAVGGTCLNAPAIPAALDGSTPELTVTDRGSSSSTQADTITWNDSVAGTTDTAYIPYNDDNWWAETVSNSAGALPQTQTLSIDYTDWSGNEQQAWLVGAGNGGYTFLTARVGSTIDEAGCVSAGTCAVTSTLDMVAPDGTDFSVSVPAPPVPLMPPPEPGATETSTVALTSSPDLVYGTERTTLTAAIADTDLLSGANGTISFDDVTPSGSVALCASVPVGPLPGADTVGDGATCTASLPVTGSQTIYAVYSGDDTHLPARTELDLDVLPPASSYTTVTASSYRPTAQTEDTFTATVHVPVTDPPVPGGTVTFSVPLPSTGRPATLCTAPLEDTSAGEGTATCQQVLPVGGDSDATVTATYSGDGTTRPSAGGTAVEVLLPTQTYLSTSNADPTVGEKVTYTATVINVPADADVPAATQTVQFTGTPTALACGPSLLETNTAGEQVATCTVYATAAGAEHVTATYVGDGIHAGSTSPFLNESVGQGTVTATVSGSQISGSATPTFTYTVTRPAGVPGTTGVSLSGSPPGVGVTGTAACRQVGSGTPIGPALAVGSYTIEGAGCSGLSLTDPTDYKLVYAGGTFTVESS